MRLAANETKLTLNTATVTLRPSLRAAYTLLAPERALEHIHRGIRDFDTGVIARIVTESATDRDDAEHFVGAMLHGRLALNHAVISTGLEAHLCALMGISNRKDQKEASGESAPRVTLSEYFEELYRIGTGWLWWTPEATWEATPTEIEEAYAGRIAFLKVIFGTGEAPTSDSPDFERDEEGIAKLKAMAMGGKARG